MPQKKKYKLAVYIGRFQPFHRGHEFAGRSALEIAERVLILVGSSFQPRSIKNPFLWNEREAMIRTAFEPDDPINVAFIRDFPYNDQNWIADVQRQVFQVARAYGVDDSEIVLVGHEKDKSSFYLKFFPQWKYHDTGFEQLEGFERKIDATRIRELLFEDQLSYTEGLLNPKVLRYINQLKSTGSKKEEWANLVAEHEYIKKYKKSWAAAPYPPTFVTVDSVVIQSGHVLVVARGDNPGKGLYAIPGGFLETNERIIEGAIRELTEETAIKLQPDTIRRCFVTSEVFDNPDRSLRGRTITHAVLFKLNDAIDLPKVRGSDDAAEAFWLPLAELDSEYFFEDHYHIIQHMIGKL